MLAFAAVINCSCGRGGSKGAVFCVEDAIFEISFYEGEWIAEEMVMKRSERSCALDTYYRLTSNVI
jgi:hypothetical protein